ncbi:hypothetical protein D6779_06145 [Candidatus Parcubacteria bacterium]|nr:MAG: hypothetical protein D6779_06145 [Candidatus Parcubacteria bacterium]
MSRTRLRDLVLHLSSMVWVALMGWGVFALDRVSNVSAGRLAALTPTPDRLAQPTLPPAPTQADRGAQVYWLWCLPCHGDRGQGLTDEFRALYPPEDNNCWLRGCHGKNPYEEGFVVPRYIPPLIGPTALQRFATAEQLHAYIQVNMPYWRPGILSDDEVWMVTAFLLRENGYWPGMEPLGPANASRVALRSPASASLVVRMVERLGTSLLFWIFFLGSVAVVGGGIYRRWRSSGTGASREVS